MTTLTLHDLAKKMAGIDFTMLQTFADNGEIAGRPMSNNGDVDYDGDSWFFSLDSTDMVRELQAEPKAALSFVGSKGLLGKPPLFVFVQGKGRDHPRQGSDARTLAEEPGALVRTGSGHPRPGPDPRPRAPHPLLGR